MASGKKRFQSGAPITLCGTNRRSRDSRIRFPQQGKNGRRRKMVKTIRIEFHLINSMTKYFILGLVEQWNPVTCVIVNTWQAMEINYSWVFGAKFGWILLKAFLHLSLSTLFTEKSVTNGSHHFMPSMAKEKRRQSKKNL